jgi:signal transduction histidine kinase
VVENRSLDTLVRTMLDVRLALVAIAMIVEAVSGGSALAMLLLVLALPLSYVPLRRWAAVGPHLARRPALLAIDALLAVALTVLVTDPAVMLLYSVCTVVLAALVAGPPGTVLVTTLLGGLLAVGATLAGQSGEVGAGSVATSFAFVASYVLAAAGALRLTGLMAAHERGAEAARAATQQAAQAEERGRLAREMHDSLSKTVSGTHLMALAVRRQLAEASSDAHLRADADRLVTACDIATRDARRLLRDLRDDQPEDATSVFRRIEQSVLEWQTRTAGEVRVTNLTDEGNDHLAASVVYELGYIVSEALDNAHRHGGAGAVDLRLEPRDGWLHLTLVDDGRGFEVPVDLRDLHRAGHYGLIGMRERAQRIGGTLDVRSTPGNGTAVAVAVPAPNLRPVERSAR